MKVLINFTIEEHIIIAFKSRVPQRERSAVIERFMEAMSYVGESNAEEEELRVEIDSLRNRLKETSSLIAEKSALLEFNRARNKESAVQIKEEFEGRLDAVKAFNPLDR